MVFHALSPQAMFQAWAAKHRPKRQFEGETPKDVEQWRERVLPEVMATLGTMPEHVPPNPELLVEYEHDGLRKQRWGIDVSDGISVHFICNIPRDVGQTEKRPALLCCHGHGAHGKEKLMGNVLPGAGHEKPDAGAYGHALAKAGFVTFAIDWIGFGERNDNQKPNFLNTNKARDWCNLYYLHATMLGTTPLAINITHGKEAIDFAATLPNVDAARLGVIGCSLGGTMALWMSLADERIRATEVVCYSGLWAYFGVRDINYCGSQVAPGLYALVDLPDLQGLLAPRPLLVDIGAVDSCFKVDEAMRCYQRVADIYACADAADRLELDLFPGEHGWAGNKSAAFFDRHLCQ